MKPRVLVADDQKDVVDALRLLLKGEGFTVDAVSSPVSMLAALDAAEYDVALVDLNYARDTTSGREGLDLLKALRERDDALSVVVMTAWATVDIAVEAMKRGARDFVPKPWDNARLLATLSTQSELTAALRRSRKLEAEAFGDPGADPEMVAGSAAMRAVMEVVQRVGPSDVNVLLLGENGSGKGTLARILHSLSPRRARPLVTVNAGGLSESLFESELFGHVKGAFTDARADRVGRFELADGATLFLDEIGNVPLAMQAKLLRVVETGEFEAVGSSRTKRTNARLITATNTDLDDAVSAGRFREDLLFRLNTIEIRVPPLRERREDIPVLAQRFLETQARRYRKSALRFEAEALETLLQYPWPGNVRELEHAIERAVILSHDPVVRSTHLSLRSRRGEAAADRRLEEMSLEDVETYLIRRALARFDGNVSRAADALGLSRSALYRRLERYSM